MRIVGLLKKESIRLNADPKSKSEAIDMLVDLQVMGGRTRIKSVFCRSLKAYYRRQEN